MEPIFPMEPITCSKIPQGQKWVSQIKWDGVRMLTYSDGEKVQLFNRKKNERTRHYPELTQEPILNANSFILDGEIIAMGQDGVPSFHEVMRRDGIRQLSRVDKVKQTVPITYMVFDLLFLNGEWLTHRSLSERIKLLNNCLSPHPHVQRVESQENGEALFEVMKQYGMEGIVTKDLNASYVIDGKQATWQKIKIIRDVNAVVGGFSIKNGTVNALLIGLYGEAGGLWYIGHVGTGKLTKEEWRELTTVLESLEREGSPFANPSGRDRDTHYVAPQLVVKVHFAEWTIGHSLRQPSIQGVVDMPPEDCTFKKEAPEQREG